MGHLVRGYSGESPLCRDNWRQKSPTQSNHPVSHGATPTQLPTRSPHTASPHSSHHTAPPTQSWGSVKPTGTGEGPGPIRGSEECAQCEGSHEYTLPAHRGGGCPVPLTAATSMHVVTHSVISVHNDYSYVHACVYGVQIRQGVCCRGTQRMHKRCKH